MEHLSYVSIKDPELGPRRCETLSTGKRFWNVHVASPFSTGAAQGYFFFEDQGCFLGSSDEVCLEMSFILM